jgi:hypothetical protein
MKAILKSFCTISALIFASLIFPSLTVHAQNPRIRIDGEFIQIQSSDQQPVIIDGRTLVPLRVVMETLGFNVEWNAQTWTVSLAKQGYDIVAQIGSNDMSVNNNIISLDVSAQIMGSRTMVPLRAISEATGLIVLWDDTNYIVDIYTEEGSQSPIAPRREPITEENWPEHLPRYIPGSITLNSEDNILGIVDQDGPVRFRYVYYILQAAFIDLINPDEREEWEKNLEYDEYDDFMYLMLLVQHFNIPREDFDAIVEELRESFVAFGFDLTDESNELPNADIIYTFDNDIIQYYYRRE